MNSDRFKFRGRRTDTGDWVYGYYVNWIEGIRQAAAIIVHLEDVGLLDDPMERYFVTRETVGQCADMLDSQGEPVYEGDVIKGDYKDRYVICLDPRNGSNLCKKMICDSYANPVQSFEGFDPFLFIGKHCEIIGNIHDNPELLDDQT